MYVLATIGINYTQVSTEVESRQVRSITASDQSISALFAGGECKNGFITRRQTNCQAVSAGAGRCQLIGDLVGAATDIHSPDWSGA